MHNNPYSCKSTPINPHVPIDESAWNKTRELVLSWTALISTLIVTVILTREQWLVILSRYSQMEWLPAGIQVLFLLIFLILIAGGLVYQVTRLAYVIRRRSHQAISQDELQRFSKNNSISLLIMVPSYKEEPRIIWQTLVSAALQEYPHKEVVLLIDDPVPPASDSDWTNLNKARRLPHQLQALLDGPAQEFKQLLVQFDQRHSQGTFDLATEIRLLSKAWQRAGDWFMDQSQTAGQEHCDRLFVDQVLLKRQETCFYQATCLLQTEFRGTPLDLRDEYLRLVRYFDVKLSCFERKAYVNLSHQSNKAMNLNSYIGLIGKNWRIEPTPNGPKLLECGASQADWRVPAFDYLIVLDADSLLLPDYALRLVHLMEQPGNERIAVSQTPYSAFPGVTSPIERLAGATTDIQYIIHQGFTQFQATYWVGANAVIRTRALQEIVVREVEAGLLVNRFIQDRTVIEDTELSIDLSIQGWRLYNYPERLTYSATPPDFGSLIIQRRRWANGGLIIFPKLIKYLIHSPLQAKKLFEVVLRAHYLLSITLANICLVMLIVLPFSQSSVSLWASLAALPYFLLYSHDLSLAGYRKRDFFGVYALNLLLVPVNLAGVFKSIHQARTGKKIPFGRTPKVVNRTAVAPVFILLEFFMIFLGISGAFMDILDGKYGFAVFALFNSCLLIFAVIKLIGLQACLEDLQIIHYPLFMAYWWKKETVSV